MLKKLKTEVDNEEPPIVTERITIPPIRMQTATFVLNGETPFVSNNFSQEMQQRMAEKQKQGSRAQKGQKRAAKDFDADYRGSMHLSTEGWYGFPASAFRQALVDACRTCGFKMTVAKLGVFVLADGQDADSGQPLIRIEGGKPDKFISPVRLADGSPDIKARGRWMKWSMKLRIEFDSDMFNVADIANLLTRVGRQVGIGAGRPYSRTSCGQGWGTFRLQDAPPK